MKNRLITKMTTIGFMGASIATLNAGDAYVNAAGVQQVIRGFGGATVAPNLNQPPFYDSDANALFSNGTPGQIGLSINRVEISSDKQWSKQRDISKKANARGAITFGTVWSPPTSMKSNKSIVRGSLNTGSYGEYATWLNEFSTFMAADGASVYAVSIANEPDITEVNYASCDWTSDQLLNFMKNNADDIGTRVMMPESKGANFSLSDPTLKDDTASANTSIIGVHLYYNASIRPYDLAKNEGKEYWMTEHYLQGAPRNTNITDALVVAREINDCMTVANMNAYVWWWLKDDYIGFINEAGAVTKYGYIAGQFAKFVRPGYRRVDSTYNPTAGVYVSSYTGGGNVVIVAINQGTSAVTQKFFIQNKAVSTVTPWVTTGSVNMSQGAKITVGSAANFTATLPAQSVTTFVSIPEGTYSLKNHTTGLVVDNRGSTSNAADVGQWTDQAGNNNQKYVLSYNNSGYAKLMCVTGSKFLDSIGRSTAGSYCSQYSDSTSNNQQWTISDQGNGYYEIINRGNGLCLDSGGDATNGAPLKFWSNITHPNLEWQLVNP